MKPTLRKLLYSTLVLSCVLFAAFIFMNGKSKSVYPELRQRQGVLANAAEWPIRQETFRKLLSDLKSRPNDPKLQLQLAREYMQEGRVTGNYGYYNKSALDMINVVLQKDPKNFDALCLKAMVFLSQHRFAEGLSLASEGQKANPYNAFIYGLLVDANVELGQYQEAVGMADKMVGIRPDIRSYSRVSYLREIHGDMPGAVEAIQMAIASGFPGNEDTEWARMVLGHLYEDSNRPEEAEKVYNAALAERPDYPFALAGLGRIARFKKDYPAAIRYFEQAKGVMTDGAFFEELIDLYRLNGQLDKSETCAKVTIDAVASDNITAAKDQNAGHYADRELALLYLKTNQLDQAYQYAQTEQQRRPKNIDACLTLAWVLYRQGKAADALPLIETALRTNSRNPELLVIAGLVKKSTGMDAEGRRLVAAGLALKPYMDETLVQAANAI
jgi:tetratricopeptide (TPR) repeat protein